MKTSGGEAQGLFAQFCDGRLDIPDIMKMKNMTINII